MTMTALCHDANDATLTDAALGYGFLKNRKMHATTQNFQLLRVCKGACDSTSNSFSLHDPETFDYLRFARVLRFTSISLSLASHLLLFL